jgi:glycosyltransferase involved in cell wall biosynthesis
MLRALTVRVVHVIAGLDPAHGGPSYTVPRLCAALAEAGSEVALLSVALRGGGPSESFAEGYSDRRFPWDYAGVPGIGRLRYSSALARGLRSAAAVADVIHDHGLWLMPNVQAGRFAGKAKKPFVVAPRGMLSPAALKFSGKKKLAFWHLLQGAVVQSSACLHATSEQEYQEIRAFGLSNPVAIIPNGIDLFSFSSGPLATNNTERTVLSPGRIHPKKGLDSLLQAWARVEAQHPNWRCGSSDQAKSATTRNCGRLRLN